MPRLNVVDPETATGKAKELFDGPLKGKYFNIYKGLANSPAAVEALLALGKAFSKGVLTPQEREVIALAVGEVNGCTYCTAAHTVSAKMSGMTIYQTFASLYAYMDV